MGCWAAAGAACEAAICCSSVAAAVPLLAPPNACLRPSSPPPLARASTSAAAACVCGATATGRWCAWAAVKWLLLCALCALSWRWVPSTLAARQQLSAPCLSCSAPPRQAYTIRATTLNCGRPFCPLAEQVGAPAGLFMPLSSLLPLRTWQLRPASHPPTVCLPPSRPPLPACLSGTTSLMPCPAAQPWRCARPPPPAPLPAAAAAAAPTSSPQVGGAGRPAITGAVMTGMRCSPDAPQPPCSRLCGAPPRPAPAPPADGSTCVQKKAWGQCGADWMATANWCAATCGRCAQAPVPAPVTSPTGTCIDQQPSDGSTCSQLLLWGRCGAQQAVAGGWCAATCGRCAQPAPASGAGSSGCTDNAPAGGFTCKQQKAWGKVGRGGNVLVCCNRGPGRAAAAELQTGSPACPSPPPFPCQCAEPWMTAGNLCAASCGRCQAGVDTGTPAGADCRSTLNSKLASCTVGGDFRLAPQPSAA